MSSYTYPRALRLLTPADFQVVFNANPKKFSCRYYTILACPNKRPKPRLGFTVSKKKAKLAVDRNSIKRVVRNEFRLQQHNLPCFDLVFIPKVGITKASKQELRDELNYTWTKLKKFLTKS